MVNYTELAEQLTSEGHYWSGKPALLFFDAGDAVRDLTTEVEKLQKALETAQDALKEIGKPDELVRASDGAFALPALQHRQCVALKALEVIEGMKS